MTARSGGWHSRFLDLPVPLCINLVTLGDRPCTVERRPGRPWLSLARGFLALHSRQPDEGRVHLAAASGPWLAPPKWRPLRESNPSCRDENPVS